MKGGTPSHVALLLSTSALVGLAALLTHPELREGPSPQLRESEISVDIAKAWGTNVLWLDARSPERFALEHVPGALSFDPARWEESLGELLRHWHDGVKTVVYCNATGCNLSKELAERLRAEAGLPDVYYLRGGWEEWRKQQR